jgi:hypothetical protein
MSPVRNKPTEDQPESPVSRKLTADALLRSPLIGLWSDRTDITDSSEFARDLRKKAGARER